jgi:hypothetical protein
MKCFFPFNSKRQKPEISCKPALVNDFPSLSFEREEIESRKKRQPTCFFAALLDVYPNEFRQGNVRMLG